MGVRQVVTVTYYGVTGMTLCQCCCDGVCVCVGGGDLYDSPYWAVLTDDAQKMLGETPYDSTLQHIPIDHPD